MIYVALLAVILLLRLLLPQNTKKSRLAFTVISCLLLTLVAALRAPVVGRDTALFLEVFAKLSGRPLLDALQFSSWVEPGFRLLLLLISRFTANGQWVIAITAVFINVSVSVFLYRHTQNVYLGFFFYLTLMLYPFYFNIMRQALAIAILLFAWGLFKKRCFLRYVLIVLLAATFHTSALLFLLCPLLARLPVNRPTLKVLLPLTALLAVGGALCVRPILRLVTALVPRYADYRPTSFLALYGFLAVFLLVSAYGIYQLYYARTAPSIGEREGEIDTRAFLTLMMLLGVIVAAMMTQFGQLQRLFNYFEVLYLLWLPAVLPPVYFHTERRQLAFPVVLIAACLAAVAYFLVILFLRSALWYDALPYRFFWQI